MAKISKVAKSTIWFLRGQMRVGLFSSPEQRSWKKTAYLKCNILVIKFVGGKGGESGSVSSAYYKSVIIACP